MIEEEVISEDEAYYRRRKNIRIRHIAFAGAPVLGLSVGTLLASDSAPAKRTAVGAIIVFGIWATWYYTKPVVRTTIKHNDVDVIGGLFGK